MKYPFVVTFLYQGWNSSHYDVEKVNVLRRMVSRNLRRPHKFAVFVDRPYEGFDDEIIVLKMSTHWLEFGRCFPRLQMFNDETLKRYADRVLMLDLDCVIVGGLDFLFTKHREEKIVFWRDVLNTQGQISFCYNGGLVVFDPRSNENLAENFPGEKAIAKSGFNGSDQAYYRYELGPDMPVVDHLDGILSYKFDRVRSMINKPDDARIIMFHGNPKPWDEIDKKLWIKNHYR